MNDAPNEGLPGLGLCVRCQSFVAAEARLCPDCGTETLDNAACKRLQEATSELAARVSATPYLRDATRLAYTPRGQVPGFLEDGSHPLARALLSYLFVIAKEALPGHAPHQLLRLATETWLRPPHPTLISVLSHLQARRAEALRRAAMDDDPTGLWTR